MGSVDWMFKHLQHVGYRKHTDQHWHWSDARWCEWRVSSTQSRSAGQSGPKCISTAMIITQPRQTSQDFLQSMTVLRDIGPGDLGTPLSDWARGLQMISHGSHQKPLLWGISVFGHKTHFVIFQGIILSYMMKKKGFLSHSVSTCNIWTKMHNAHRVQPVHIYTHLGQKRLSLLIESQSWWGNTAMPWMTDSLELRFWQSGSMTSLTGRLLQLCQMLCAL